MFVSLAELQFGFSLFITVSDQRIEACKRPGIFCAYTNTTCTLCYSEIENSPVAIVTISSQFATTVPVTIL